MIPLTFLPPTAARDDFDGLLLGSQPHLMAQVQALLARVQRSMLGLALG